MKGFVRLWHVSACRTLALEAYQPNCARTCAGTSCHPFMAAETVLGPSQTGKLDHEVLISNLFRWIKKPMICMLGVFTRDIPQRQYTCISAVIIKSQISAEASDRMLFRWSFSFSLLDHFRSSCFHPKAADLFVTLGRIWFTAWPVLLWCLVYWPGSLNRRNPLQSGFMNPTQTFWVVPRRYKFSIT